MLNIYSFLFFKFGLFKYAFNANAYIACSNDLGPSF